LGDYFQHIASRLEAHPAEGQFQSLLPERNSDLFDGSASKEVDEMPSQAESQSNTAIMPAVKNLSYPPTVHSTPAFHQHFVQSEVNIHSGNILNVEQHDSPPQSRKETYPVSTIVPKPLLKTIEILERRINSRFKSGVIDEDQTPSTDRDIPTPQLSPIRQQEMNSATDSLVNDEPKRSISKLQQPVLLQPVKGEHEETPVKANPVSERKDPKENRLTIGRISVEVISAVEKKRNVQDVKGKHVANSKSETFVSHSNKLTFGLGQI
jgi:hypothetical protein